MSNHLQEDGSFINSIVGEGTVFCGELELSGLLRIDGDFSGTIRTGGKVLVGVNGRAECTIRAGTVVIGGVVKGNIFAEEKVLVLSTGMMIGNISSPRLIAEEGVVMHGTCMITREKDEQLVRDTPELFGESTTKSEVEVETSGERPDGERVYSGASKNELGSWNA